ncbi:MAG: histidine--tRNA ligase [Owenweeksia sp.]|nr:histidine--tRNA ligase [Owenweeksia sp.]
MSVKPSLPKGTRDMLPETMLRREYILDILKKVFKKYGFAPIETPAMENVETLTGKYGEEGDKLIYKIRSNKSLRDKLSDKKKVALDEIYDFWLPQKSEMVLRYDLTVPFARFVVQNQNDIHFPFKRYQIQPVWRADRPQKGRFREFYQCDADAVGSDSLLLELDFVRIYQEAFASLKVPVQIKINNRKVLAGIAETLGISDRLTDFTVALDKLDKVGLEGVKAELEKKGFDQKVQDGIGRIAGLKGSAKEILKAVEEMISGSETGKKGVEELRFVLENCDPEAPLAIDLTLARGLDYYTGAIFEVVAPDVNLGSVGGGGRYDDLTAIFGMKGLSGIGISFGLDRIYLVMEELGLFPDVEAEGTEVLFINFGDQEGLFSLKLANELRDLQVKAEVYPDSSKLRKQMDFANKKNIPYVVLIGSEEMKSGQFTVKHMHSGEQHSLSRIELLQHFTENASSDYGRH